MYRYESWIIKKAKCWRIETFKLWCWKRLESPLDSKEIKPVNPKGNQSWIFIGKTDAEGEAPILGYVIWKANSLEKIMVLGKTEGRRRRGWQRMKWLDGISDSVDMSLRKIQEMVKDRKPSVLPFMGSQSQTWLSDQTTKTLMLISWIESSPVEDRSNCRLERI